MSHILIVDDQANVRTAVVQLLLSCNRPDLNVDQVSNGADALRKLQAKKYDLLISDTEMPGMNGAELMHAVRADEKLKALPVIMMRWIEKFGWPVSGSLTITSEESK